MTEKIDEVTNKYFQNVIKNSWTWQRLTEEEKQRFVNLDVFNKIKGNKDTREQWLFTIYAGFLWCGSKMKRGANRMGAGVNSFSLWCDNCGAVVVHACNFGKKITGYEVKWDVQ